ncbi:hypothetical protein VPH35_045254 [Triticum aestivum]
MPDASQGAPCSLLSASSHAGPRRCDPDPLAPLILSLMPSNLPCSSLSSSEQGAGPLHPWRRPRLVSIRWIRTPSPHRTRRSELHGHPSPCSTSRRWEFHIAPPGFCILCRTSPTSPWSAATAHRVVLRQVLRCRRSRGGRRSRAPALTSHRDAPAGPSLQPASESTKAQPPAASFVFPAGLPLHLVGPGPK